MADNNYTSRRQYLTQDELEQFADITVTDPTEADDQISMAEELIDSYVGSQDSFIKQEFQGKLTAVSGTTVYDTSGDTPLNLANNYFTYCEIEIIGGTGKGQRRIIASSNKDNYSVTVRDAWDTAPDDTSVYRIYQLGKFPLCYDYFYEPDSDTYYKTIPEAVKRATAAQIEFIVTQGAKYFAGDSTDFDSESIDTYSYSKGSNGNSLTSKVKLIAPKARSLLSGYINRTGQLIVDNPTEY